MIFSKINNSIQLEITKIKRNRVVRTWGIIREGLLEGGALIETLQSVLTISLTDVQSSIGLGVGWISFSSLYNLYSHILVQANNGNQVSQLRLLERDHNFMVSKMKCLKMFDSIIWPFCSPTQPLFNFNSMAKFNKQHPSKILSSFIKIKSP